MRRAILFICVFFSFFFVSNTLAASKEDVIQAINMTYTVGKETYRLPQKIITKGEKYLNKHPLTSEEYDKILVCIDNAVSLAREVGTTDITKVSKEELNRALKILVEASNTAHVNLEKELTENNISIPSIGQISHTQSNSEKNQNWNQNNTLSENDGSISGNEIKEQDALETSGNQIFETPLSGEHQGNLSNSDVGEVEDFNQETDKIIGRNITFAILGLILILFILFLLIYLLFKSKWNRILKCIVLIIFVILALVILVTLAIIASYQEEIKLIYELYYLFNK